jgi:hypothetical protein
MMMKRQLQLFLTHDDEVSLSRVLATSFPSIAVIDDNVWPTQSPCVVDGIADCKTSFAFLWPRAICATLPTRRRNDGRYEGPTSGVVVQLVRSRLSGSNLLSGRIAVASDTPDMTAFISELWRVLKSWGVPKARSIDPRTGDTISPNVSGYLVGPDAACWQRVPDRCLRDRSTENYFAVLR